jgi:hypothetical protein
MTSDYSAESIPYFEEPDIAFFFALYFSIFSSSMSIFLNGQLFQYNGYRKGRKSNLLSSGE